MVLSCSPASLQIAGQDIPTVTKATYLGFPFVAGVGLDVATLAHDRALAAQRASSIIHRFREAQCTYVPLLRQLYLTYVRPCFFYGTQIAGYTEGQVKLMQKVENGCLRAILRCPHSTSTEAMGYLLRIPDVHAQTKYLSDSWALRTANLPPDHPTLSSCEYAKRGIGKTVLEAGASLQDKNTQPRRPKDDPAHWLSLANKSNSSAMKALIVILPPFKAYHKEIMALHGPAGHALRLWLFHRLHPDSALRINPAQHQIPVTVETALKAIARQLGKSFSNSTIRVRPSNLSLSPVSYLIYLVFHQSNLQGPRKEKARKDLLTKIGNALHEWRELILHPQQPESPEPSDPSNSEPSDPLMPAGSAVDDSDDTVVL